LSGVVWTDHWVFGRGRKKYSDYLSHFFQLTLIVITNCQMKRILSKNLMSTNMCQVLRSVLFIWYPSVLTETLKKDICLEIEKARGKEKIYRRETMSGMERT
jgi:hypothetical protein